MFCPKIQESTKCLCFVVIMNWLNVAKYPFPKMAMGRFSLTQNFLSSISDQTLTVIDYNKYGVFFIRNKNCLPIPNTWVHLRLFHGVHAVHISRFLSFYICLFSLCVLCSMVLVSLNCSFLNALVFHIYIIKLFRNQHSNKQGFTLE